MKIRESIVIQFRNGLRGLLTFCIDGKIHDFGIEHRALLSIYIYISIYIYRLHNTLWCIYVCVYGQYVVHGEHGVYSDAATAQSRCNEIIEYLVRRGHGRIRTQLEVQRAMDAYRSPQQHFRNIDCGVHIVVQYHPGLPDIRAP